MGNTTSKIEIEFENFQMEIHQIKQEIEKQKQYYIKNKTN